MKHNYLIMGEKPVHIVIEMGLGSCISEWKPIAAMLSQNEGVLLYERAGINQSQKAENSRTPMHIAEELHELLLTVEHEEKIILVAHSQGGLYAQTFCRLYPEEIEKLVLVDPLAASDFNFKDKLSEKEYKKSGVDKSANFKIMYQLSKWKLGALNKAFMKKAPPFYYYDGFSKEETEDILGSFAKPVHNLTAYEEYIEAHKSENICNLLEKNSFPDIPLILITHCSKMAIEESMQFGNNTREFATQIEEMWQKIMAEYLTFSEQSVWIHAKKSTHYIHLSEPELIIQAVK